MRIPWNLEDPIEAIFQQIKTGIEYAQNGNTLYTNRQIINIAYILMVQAGVFKDTCKEQRNKQEQEKTQPNFKNTFFTAYTDWK